MFKNKISRTASLIIAVVILCILPFVVSKYWLHILIMCMFNSIFATSLWITMRMGYLSFGHAAYIGTGAYTSALLSIGIGVPVGLSIVIAGMFAALVGFIMGKITLSLRGIYFSITVFAFTEVLRAIWLGFDKPFGGAGGIINIQRPQPLGISLESHISFYYFLFVCGLLIMLFIHRLDRSKFGFICRGIQTADSELLSRMLGVNTAWYKTMAFTISCLFAGLGGALFAHYTGYISPFVFTFWLSTDAVIYVMIGGAASMVGPILGGSALTIVSEMLFGAGYYRAIFFGVALLVIILGLPGGLISIPERFKFSKNFGKQK